MRSYRTNKTESVASKPFDLLLTVFFVLTDAWEKIRPVHDGLPFQHQFVLAFVR